MIEEIPTSMSGSICSDAPTVPPFPEKPMFAPRSSHWAKTRREHLEKHPTCEACGGTTDLEVHHELPYHIHPELELDEKNLITLCEKPGHVCHYVFGHAHNWKGYVKTVRDDAAKHLKDVHSSNKLAAHNDLLLRAQNVIDKWSEANSINAQESSNGDA